MGRKPSQPWIGRDAAHGEVYRFAFTVGGRRYRGSTGERDPEAAARYVDKLRAEITLGRAPVERPEPRRVRALGSVSLELLAAEFIASLEGRKSRGYTAKIESHFRAHFLPRWQTIFDVTAPHAIDDWTTERLNTAALERGKVRGRARGRLDRKPSTVTVHKEQVTLSRFLKWAQKKTYLDEVPRFERVVAVSGYVAPDYTPDMVRALLVLIPDRHTHCRRFAAREWFTVQWSQAFRAEKEIATLTWSDIDLERGTIRVRAINAKSGEERVLALGQPARAVLADMASGHTPLPTALVFGRHNFRRSLEAAAAALGFPKLTRHNLRHFRLTELGNSPATAVAALQYFAGHKHMSTTDKYVRSRTSATRDMLAGLDIVSRSTATGTQSAKRTKRKNSAGGGT